jgi:hypothetical protein
MKPGRDFRVSTSGDAGRGQTRQGLFACGDSEQAEQVLSNALVQACMVRCGIPWRECGIAPDDLCLLAMQGAARPAGQADRALRGGRDESSPDALIHSC